MTSAVDNEHSLKRKRNYGSIAAVNKSHITFT